MIIYFYICKLQNILFQLCRQVVYLHQNHIEYKPVHFDIGFICHHWCLSEIEIFSITIHTGL